MGDSAAETSLCFSSLLCQEDESCLNEMGYEESFNTCIDIKPYCFVAEDEDEYIENLFKRETTYFGSKGLSTSDDCSTICQSWLKSARLDAVEWIFNTRAVFGFHYRTAYLSVTYFDRFISKRYIDNGKMWAIRLLSVACLSLAAKMEECNVPILSEFPTSDYDFESNAIQRMELLVLSTLEWKLGSITPFTYLNYFINKFCGDSRPKELVSSAVHLIVAMAKEASLIDTRSSIIAAAAVLAAFDCQLTRKIMELKMNVISFWRSDDKELLYSTYSLVQEIEKGAVRTPELSISPNVLSIHSSSHYLNENASFNSGVGTKRRLTFNESDHSSPEKKVHRT
ncbi:cyclin-D5-1 [Humulus lupulus]|uniref:cyclin-D5-1 n=1 Tax=Humulus lupulus TaxID=3486 RepID=UPI002B4140DC|nr:cyclin-D5-1 [Humulus lupulus]